MNLSIIIPFYNGYDFIRDLVADLSYYDLPVIIVDDLSDRPLTFDFFIGRRPQSLRIVRMERKGYFTGAVNYGVSIAGDSDILVLNQDARLTGDAWQSMLAEKSKEYAMIGDRIKGLHPAWPGGYIQGTFMYVRRDAIEKAGLMNDVDFPLWGSTCDWQTRIARKGFSVLPVIDIPGFSHERPGKFGSSITQVLKDDPSIKDRMIRTPPLVSVVVPCYNYGRFLPDLVSSLIGGPSSLGDMEGQTFSAFEVILVDDASTDDTPGVIRSLVDPFKGIRSVRRSIRGGTAAANNTGIRASYGRAVTILGADDMMMADRLRVMYDAWNEDRSRVVYDDNSLFKDGQIFHVLKLPEYDFEKLIHRNHVHCGILFARSAFDAVGGYPEEMILGREDWAMNVRLGMNGFCGYHINKPMYLYRREGHNRTLRNTSSEMLERYKIQMRALFPDVYKGVRSMACCGGKGSNSQMRNNKAVVQKPVSGSGDMTLVVYNGTSWGWSTYYGPVTGQIYRFGLSRSTGYVYNVDLVTGSMRTPGILEIQENGKSIFSVMKDTSDAQAIVPQAMVEKISEGAAPVPYSTPEDVVTPSVSPDVASMTLAQVRKLISEAPERQVVTAMIDAEKSGKNRKGVLSILLDFIESGK